MENKAVVFRVNDGQGPELLIQVFMEKGWQEYDEDTQSEYDWNIWWKSSRFRACDYDQLMPWQRLNHYPKSTGITRKDCLARNLKRMRGVYGAGVFNFSPIAFNLPNDYTRYVAEYTKMKQNSEVKNLLWICKPADLSRGRGIFIFRDLSELQYDCSAVVQRYIPNPLLISGYKFDVRIYVAVPSFHPLSVYIYQEGIVRFSTEKFDLNNIGNIFAHLTNTSINKHSPTYSTDKERVGHGCKWTLNQLRYYFHQNNINDSKIWKRVVNIVILTLLTQAPMVAKIDNCFELYGFDILIDENLKPWLLEVNFSPALSSDCQVDVVVKKQMLHDLMDMMNFKSTDIERGGEPFQQQINKSCTNYTPDRNSSVSRLSRVSSLQKLPTMQGKNRKSSALADDHNDTPRTGGFMCMADSEEVDAKPIFGLPLVHHSEDEGCSSEKDEEDPHPSRSVRKGRSDMSLPKSTSNVSHTLSDQSSRSRDSSMYESRSARSNSSARKPGYKLHKVHSKGSSISDSGISSFSGSSENSDLVTKQEKLSLYCNTSTNANSEHCSESGIETIQIDDGKMSSKMEPIPRKPSIKRYGYAKTFKKSKSPFKSVSQLTTVTKVGRNGFVRSANNYEVGDRSPADDTSQSSPTPTKFSLRRRRSQTSIADTTQIRKAASITKHNVTALNTGPASNNHRPYNGSRKLPLRQVKSHFTVTKPGAPKGPKEVIGNFFLVFPFNDVTRRASSTSLDSRLIIRETQKVLKETMGKSGVGACESDVPKLWGPLKFVDGS